MNKGLDLLLLAVFMLVACGNHNDDGANTKKDEMSKIVTFFTIIADTTKEIGGPIADLLIYSDEIGSPGDELSKER